MVTMTRLLLFVGLGVGFHGFAHAQTRALAVPKISSPLTLEAIANGDREGRAAKIADFRQRKPADGVPVSQETTAYLAYDETKLYVVFVCKDRPDKVRARLSKREQIESDDQVAVYLDTFRDRQRAYLFAANPLGAQLDGIITEGQDDDYSFDTLWHSEGRLTPNGFVVLMAIPFKSLRFANAPEQTWGIALGRSIARTNEEAYWPHVTERVEGFTQQMATLTGLERISPGRNMQLIPYGIYAGARFLDADSTTSGVATEQDARIGLDAKLVLRDAFTLDAAVNPDFSQVESDEPQVTVNQRFEVFFPEKRPFFLENAGLFRTPINLFFSRRIADPQFGGRLTGKMGRWAFGALGIDDRAPTGRQTISDSSDEPRAGIGIVRLQREFSEQSSFGVFVTNRTLASASNRVAALDTRLKLTPNWIFNGQIAHSGAAKDEGTGHSGSAYYAELARDGRHFTYAGRYLDVTPGFRADLGFVRRVDVRQIEHEMEYSWRPAGRVVDVGPVLSVLANWDRQHRLQDWEIEAEFEVEFTGNSEIKISRSEAFELFENHGFRRDATTVKVESEWLRWLVGSAFYSRGTNVNFDPAPGLDPFLANAADAGIEVSLRPTPRLRIDQTYLYNALRGRRPLANGQRAGSTDVFTNHILRSTLNYQFTRALSLRTILDYEALAPNPLLVDLDREKRFAADILVGYLLNPGTALYVGYTDRYENVALEPGQRPTLRRTPSLSASTARQLFIKTSYLWRF